MFVPFKCFLLKTMSACQENSHWKRATVDSVAGFLTNMTMREKKKTSYVSDGSFSNPDISLTKIFIQFFDRVDENFKSNLCSESQAFSTSSDQRPCGYKKLYQVLQILCWHADQIPIKYKHKYQCLPRQILIYAINIK